MIVEERVHLLLLLLFLPHCRGSQTKDFGCNTDLYSDHKFRHQLCTKEFKGEVNQEMERVIKMGIELRSFISKL